MVPPLYVIFLSIPLIASDKFHDPPLNVLAHLPTFRSYESNISNYDAELRINEAVLVQSPDI